MLKLGWFFLLIGFFSIGTFEVAWAQNYDLGEGLSLTQTQINELKTKLPKTKSESVFYHWTNMANYLRWQQQGHVDHGEVSFLNRPTGNLQVYGPGIYMATSPESSRSFGVAAVTFKVAAGTTILDQAEIKKIINRDLTLPQLSKLGAIFPSIRPINGDWYVGNHPTIFSRVGNGENEGAKMHFDTVMKSNYQEQIFQISQQHEGARYLSKLFALFSYMDGVALFRAIKINPNAPWNEFEPHRFETYWKGRQELLTMAGAQEFKHIAQWAYFGKDIEKETWVKKQIEEVLPKIYEKLSGERKDLSSLYRTEGVRAGGNYQGDTFLATDSELSTLKTNRYLEVISNAHPSGRGHLVHYYYPDALHFKHLEHVLSAELMQELKKHSPDKLMQDHRLRQTLNKRIIKELLSDVFARNHKTQVTYEQIHNVKFMQDLISIHPFGDFNGRSVRMYFELANKTSAVETPIHMMSDLDLLTSPEKYLEVLKKGAVAGQTMQRALMQELLVSLKEGRMPAYRDLPAWDVMWDSLEPVGGRRADSWEHLDYELIRLRRFVELFEKKFSRMDVNAAGNCRTVFGS